MFPELTMVLIVLKITTPLHVPLIFSPHSIQINWNLTTAHFGHQTLGYQQVRQLLISQHHLHQERLHKIHIMRFDRQMGELEQSGQDVLCIHI